MTERKELIARLRDATEGPRMLMGEAADMLEADAVPPGYGWLTACDEEMICYHLGVANLSDNYESAKRKLRALIDLNVAIATDPAVNGGMSLQPAVPQEPVAWQPIETAPKDGSRVLLWWDGAAREGWCAGAGKSRDGGDWWRSHSLTVCAGRPTQWMSLPPAPEGSPQKSPVLTDAEIIQAIEQRFAPAVSAVPVAYLAWRDGKPCWEGDDCVCADAVYPVDHDDDRTSMPVYLAPPPQPRLTDAEIKAIEHETDMKSSIGDWSNYFARAIEAKVRGEA